MVQKCDCQGSDASDESNDEGDASDDEGDDATNESDAEGVMVRVMVAAVTALDPSTQPSVGP